MNPKYDITVQLVGQDSNVFNLMSIVNRELAKHGVSKSERDEFLKEVMNARSNDEALRVIMSWVNVK